MVCILIEIRNLEGSKSVMVQAECERYYSRGPVAMRCERTRALTTLPRPAGVLQTQQGSDVMNYAAILILSYIFCDANMFLKDRPWLQCSRVWPTFHFRKPQQYLQKKSNKGKTAGVRIEIVREQIFIFNCRKGMYHQSPPNAFHWQKLEEQYACQLSQIRHPESPNHPLHNNQSRLLHHCIIAIMS